MDFRAFTAGRVQLELENDSHIEDVGQVAAQVNPRKLVLYHLLPMGETPDDMGFNEHWLVVDVLLNRPKPELGDFSIQYCNPARSATYVRGTGNRRRWEIALHDDENFLGAAGALGVAR